MNGVSCISMIGLTAVMTSFYANSVPTIYIKNKSERHLYVTLIKDHGGALVTDIHINPHEGYVNNFNIYIISKIEIKYCDADTISPCPPANRKSYKASFNNLKGDAIDKIYVKFTVDDHNKDPLLTPQKGALNRTEVKEGNTTHKFVSLKHNIKERNIE